MKNMLSMFPVITEALPSGDEVFCFLVFFFKATETGVTLLFGVVIVKHHTREGGRWKNGNEKNNSADENRILRTASEPGVLTEQRQVASWEKSEQKYFEKI